VDIETDLRVSLYQAARELLVNAIKYSKAARIEVRLDQTHEAVGVMVQDDGIGFDPSNVKPPGKQGGFGLFNIRETIGGLDGEFTIDTKPGEGTSASVSVPLKVSPV
jgi:signal transduction histidine kinase